jgi:hypothetical protein
MVHRRGGIGVAPKVEYQAQTPNTAEIWPWSPRLPTGRRTLN